MIYTLRFPDEKEPFCTDPTLWGIEALARTQTREGRDVIIGVVSKPPRSGKEQKQCTTERS